MQRVVSGDFDRALLCFRRRFKFYDWKEPAILDWRIPPKEASEWNLERPNDSEHYKRRLDILYVLSPLKKHVLWFSMRRSIYFDLFHTTALLKTVRGHECSRPGPRMLASPRKPAVLKPTLESEVLWSGCAPSFTRFYRVVPTTNYKGGQPGNHLLKDCSVFAWSSRKEYGGFAFGFALPNNFDID